MTVDDKKRAKAINWFQGVTVYLAITPDASPDWSKGMNQTDTLSSTTVTNPNGTIQAGFDMRDSKYDRVKVQSFQFGAALAKHSAIDETSQEVVWNSKAPAIASSVQMLSVPAAPALSRELQLINRASRWPFREPTHEHRELSFRPREGLTYWLQEHVPGFAKIWPNRRRLQLWDLTTSKEIASFESDANQYRFTADSKTLITSDGTDRIGVWDVPPGWPIKTILAWSLPLPLFILLVGEWRLRRRRKKER